MRITAWRTGSKQVAPGAGPDRTGGGETDRGGADRAAGLRTPGRPPSPLPELAVERAVADRLGDGARLERRVERPRRQERLVGLEPAQGAVGAGGAEALGRRQRR